MLLLRRGQGNSVTPGIPSIAGQPKVFIETQLVLIREELRPAPQMLPLVKGTPRSFASRSTSRSCRPARWLPARPTRH